MYNRKKHSKFFRRKYTKRLRTDENKNYITLPGGETYTIDSDPNESTMADLPSPKHNQQQGEAEKEEEDERGDNYSTTTTTTSTSLSSSSTTKTNGQHDKSKKKHGAMSKHWCFTLNNYDEQDEENIKRLATDPDTDCVYVIYGRESATTTQTPHLQGFVAFSKRKRLQTVKNKIGQAHCTIARILDKAIEYCKKEGDYVELGTRPILTKTGNRCDLDKFKEDVKAGMLSMKEIREKHSMVYARYRSFVSDYVADHSPSVNVDPYPLRKWQANLNRMLNLQPEHRKIVFIVDKVGNSGKTWFFRYYEQNHPETTQIINPGKKHDMAYILKTTNRVVFFDCPRSKQGEFLQYDFLEEIKNGNVFSGKYEPVQKRFPSPHVVVAMNEHPNMELLSEDRYEVLVVSPSDNVVSVAEDATV